MIAYWPKVITESRIVHPVLHIIDFMATFLDIAGIAYPVEFNGRAIQPLEGESFLPLLQGAEWQRERPLVWEHEGNRAVRDGRWKLVSQYPGEWVLYDMLEDRTEVHDLAKKHRPQVEKMVKMYDEWAERCGVVPWSELDELRKSNPEIAQFDKV